MLRGNAGQQFFLSDYDRAYVENLVEEGGEMIQGLSSELENKWREQQNKRPHIFLIRNDVKQECN